MKNLIKLFAFIIGAIIVCSLLNSCTDNLKSRTYGGTMEINVAKGYKVTEATWKDESSLWYMTEPMDSDYVPKTKKFIEKSPFGMIEGEVKFIESR